MPTIQIDYTPTPKQYAFHASTANEVLYGGAAGGGKTKAIVMDAFSRCICYPKTNAYVFRRTYRELEDTVISEAKASIPPELAVYNVGRHEMHFTNGSKIYFRHCATLADRFTYQGAEIHWLYFDELTHFEKEIYDYLKTRLRAKASLGITPIVRCSSNPGGIGHGWVKNYFVDAGPYMKPVSHFVSSSALGGKRKKITTQYIPSLATENPYITDDYIFELEQKPEALRRALLEGNWDAFEGQVFVEWKDDPEHYRDRRWTHVVEPFPIPASWPRFMSFDHGYSKPFSCGWWAISPDGTAYRYREWYGCTKQPNTGVKISPRQIALGIVQRETEESRENIHVSRVADPAIFDKSRGDSVADQMMPMNGQPGVYFNQGDNTRLAGKMQFHERLRFDSEGRPKLQVFSTCKDFIRTVPTLPYSETKLEDIDTDAEDHIYDETRYFLMAHPLPAAELPRVAPKEYDPFEED